MEMREKILETLSFLQKELVLKRFYRPDGRVKTQRCLNLQPYDRLLIVLDGVKNEPMSLNGGIENRPAGSGGFLSDRKTHLGVRLLS